MRKSLIYLGVLGVMVGIWVWWSWPASNPEVIVCDVGQGDGIIITQGLSQMVVDVGRGDGAMARCLGEVLPFWDKEIEMVVITHADDDHAGGLKQVLGGYKVDKIVTAEKAVRKVEEEVGLRENVVVATMGQVWLWGKVRVEVMWPPPLRQLAERMAAETNDTGLVLRLEFNNNDSAWLAADAGEKVEQMLIDWGRVKQTTMLKVSHHGSKYATTNRFLGILQPRYCVVSVGKNKYGHPTKEVLERIATIGCEVWRTDVQGQWRWRPE